jgi:hypothetical protein
VSYLGNSPTSATFRSEFFSGDDSTTAFNLAYSTGNEASVIVSISGDKAVVTPYLSADTNGIVRINASTLTENCTITTGYNASSAGPLTVANNVVVTIANNSTWTIF